MKEITQGVINILLEALKVEAERKEIRIKTEAGTLVIRLLDEEKEREELIERVKKAQDLVKEG